MILVGLSGKSGTGKTTIAEMLRKRCGWNHVALATVLKEKAKVEFGATDFDVYGDGKSKPSPYRHSDGMPMTWREVLIRLGLLYRCIDPHFWIRNLQKDLTPEKVNIISDVRFKNEANWIKERGGFLIRLHRPERFKGPDIDDPSEKDLDDYRGFSMTFSPESNRDLRDAEELARMIKAYVEGHSE